MKHEVSIVHRLLITRIVEAIRIIHDDSISPPFGRTVS